MPFSQKYTPPPCFSSILPAGNVLNFVLIVFFLSYLQNDKFVRAVANVVMLCQTFTIGDVKKKKYTRENIACKLTYMAQGMLFVVYL